MAKVLNDASATKNYLRPNYDTEEVRTGFEKIIGRRRGEFGDLLAISRPRSRLDPIAGAALKTLAPQESAEKEVRAFIVRYGIASEVQKITGRLNSRRMTEGRRWVLATTYISLLGKLTKNECQGKDREEVETLFKDDLGVAEKIMLDLEADDGPVHRFAEEIVRSVMEKNRITDSETVHKLASQQVRSAI